MIELSLFSRFVPMHILPPQERAELAKYGNVVHFETGEQPLQRHAPSEAAVFLVHGQVTLEDDGGKRDLLAGDEDARYALSNADHYVASVTCVTPTTLLFVDRAKLDYVLAWAQSSRVESADIEQANHQDEDWVGAMLQCPAMQLIPPANIARVLSRVEPMVAPAGALIIEQGAPGDSYYVLTAGTCEVWRKAAAGTAPEFVSMIGVGEGFGEEALLSGDPRNASIRAVGDCRMVRLSAADFSTLLQAPLLQRVDLDAPPARALPVDVRLAEEFAHGHVPGAVNLPLRQLRQRCAELDRSRPLVVHCDGGRRSAVATFLLCERGFDASWVPDGVPPERMTER